MTQLTPRGIRRARARVVARIARRHHASRDAGNCVLIPLTLSLRDGREVIEARNPTTGHELTIYLDEVDGSRL